MYHGPPWNRCTIQPSCGQNVKWPPPQTPKLQWKAISWTLLLVIRMVSAVSSPTPLVPNAQATSMWNKAMKTPWGRLWPPSDLCLWASMLLMSPSSSISQVNSLLPLPQKFSYQPCWKKKTGLCCFFFFQQGNEVGSALLLESIHVSV